MVEEKKILKYFLGWLIVGLIIMFVGINNTYALDYNNIGYIDNYTDVLIDVTYETENNSLLTVQKTQEVYTEIKTLFINVSNYNFNANTHYQLELSLPNMTLNNANYYEVYDSNNNNCTISNEFSTFNTAYPKWDFECKNNTNAITIKVGNRNNTAITNTGTFRWNYTYLRYTNTPIENTNQQIADNIINNQNQNTQDIINNNNQNTLDIIDSNKETQEVIKEQFNTCRESYNIFNPSNGSSVNGASILINDNTISITGSAAFSSYNWTIDVTNLNTIYLSGEIVGGGYARVYAQRNDVAATNYIDSIGKFNKTIDVTNYDTLTLYLYAKRGSGSLSEEVTSVYKNIMISERNISYEPFGEICQNKIDETNDKLNNIEGALTDSSPTDMSVLENTAGWLPPGPVDSIINLPLTFFLNLSQSLSSECRPVLLTLPYVNKNIELPCMNSVYEKIGITGIGGFYTWVGLICSAVILFNYLLDLYHWVDKTLTMRENTMPGYYEDNWGGGA